MPSLALFSSALRLAGRPWTVWVVGIALTLAHSAEGAGGFDAAMMALGPTLLWAMVSYVCRFLTRDDGRWRRSILPANKPLPKPQLALIVVPPCPPEASPGVSQMVERLPEHLRRLVMADAG